MERDKEREREREGEGGREVRQRAARMPVERRVHMVNKCATRKHCDFQMTIRCRLYA
jgi:hypothetical protein